MLLQLNRDKSLHPGSKIWCEGFPAECHSRTLITMVLERDAVQLQNRPATCGINNWPRASKWESWDFCYSWHQSVPVLLTCSLLSFSSTFGTVEFRMSHQNTGNRSSRDCAWETETTKKPPRWWKPNYNSGHQTPPPPCRNIICKNIILPLKQMGGKKQVARLTKCYKPERQWGLLSLREFNFILVDSCTVI